MGWLSAIPGDAPRCLPSVLELRPHFLAQQVQRIQHLLVRDAHAAVHLRQNAAQAQLFLQLRPADPTTIAGVPTMILLRSTSS